MNTVCFYFVFCLGLICIFKEVHSIEKSKGILLLEEIQNNQFEGDDDDGQLLE